MNQVVLAPGPSDDEFFGPVVDVPDGFKKAVGVVQVAMGQLGFLHRKIYNVLLANAYEGLGQGRMNFTLPVATLAEFSGFNSRDYQMVYDHCRELMQTEVQTINFDSKTKGKKPRRKRGATTLIADFDVIEGGTIQYGFSRKMAGILYEPEQYIWMTLSTQNRFDSKYELSLFENCIRYIGAGSTGFKDVSEWRDLLGANEPTYDEFKRLNSLVLKPATKGVNEKSGILIQPEFEREKRKVARIKFGVEENPQPSLLDYRNHSAIRGTKAYEEARAMGVEDVVIIHFFETKGEQYVADAIGYVKAKNPKDSAAYLAHTLRAGYGEKSPEDRRKLAEGRARAKLLNAKRQAEAEAKEAREDLAARFKAHQAARFEELIASRDEGEIAELGEAVMEALPNMPQYRRRWRALGQSYAALDVGNATDNVIFRYLRLEGLKRWGAPADYDQDAYAKAHAPEIAAQVE